MEEHSIEKSVRHRAWEDTKKSFHGLTFFWAVEVGLMVGLSFLGESLIPEGASRFVSAAYPAIGAVVGAIGGFGIIYFIMFFAAPYKQRNEARASLENFKQWEGFLKNIKKGDTITGKIINVPLLFQLQGVNTLASIRFVSCIFRGPCSIRIDCDSEVKGADFQGKLDEHFIELNREGTYIGLVRFVFCKFEYCKFENISIVGFKSTYDKIKENSVQL